MKKAKPLFETKFTAYKPAIKPLGLIHGGGFKLEMVLSETEWSAVKDLNDPQLSQMLFEVTIKGSAIK